MPEENSVGGICPICGLPKELCVCTAISREGQKITIKATKRRFGKLMTVIEGIDSKDIKQLAKQLKEKLACGGTVKGKIIELQGDHRNKVKELLVSMGFPPNSIEVKAKIE